MNVWKLTFTLFASLAPAWAVCNGPVLFHPLEPIELGTVEVGAPVTFRTTILFTAQSDVVTPLVDSLGPIEVVEFDPALSSLLGRLNNADVNVTVVPTAAGPQTAQIIVNGACGSSAALSLPRTDQTPGPNPIEINLTYSGFEDEIEPPFGGAMTFHQISYDYGTVSKLFSGTGRVTVDAQKLVAATGVGRGYINAAIGGRWALQNLYFDSSDDVARISAYFALHDAQLVDNNDPAPGPPVNKLDASIQVTSMSAADTPLPASLSTVRVSNVVVNAQGENFTVVAVPAIPAEQNFRTDGENFAFTQPRSNLNVEAASGQCAPSAYANSLAWLESQYDQFDVPHDNVPGLTGDDSLVGQLGEAMGSPRLLVTQRMLDVPSK